MSRRGSVQEVIRPAPDGSSATASFNGHYLRYHSSPADSGGGGGGKPEAKAVIDLHGLRDVILVADKPTARAKVPSSTHEKVVQLIFDTAMVELRADTAEEMAPWHATFATFAEEARMCRRRRPRGRKADAAATAAADDAQGAQSKGQGQGASAGGPHS